jgi:hypothetical protein
MPLSMAEVLYLQQLFSWMGCPLFLPVPRPLSAGWGVPLYDLHGRIAALERQVAVYPAALKHTIVSDMLWSVEFTLIAARKFASARDSYNTVGCLTRIANYLTHALFALNEIYYLNDKLARSRRSMRSSTGRVPSDHRIGAGAPRRHAGGAHGVGRQPGALVE